MPENAKLSWWQDRAWWRKNWWTVIVAIGVLVGAIITFRGHTSDIANLTEDFVNIEEENDSLKDLVVDLNTDILQFEMTLKDLVEDVGDLKDGIERVEGILMERDPN